METVIRIVVIYLIIVAGLRILGKREFSQLSTLELVSLLLIPEIVSQALMREDHSVTNALVGLSTLFCLVFATSALLHKSKRAEEVMQGRPMVLVSNGRFLEEAMNLERVTPDEVYGEMHKSGLYDLGQVRWALIESDGKISVIPQESAEGFHPSDGEKPAM